MPAIAESLRGEDQPGFFLVERFTDAIAGKAMLREVVALARFAAAGHDVSPSLVTKETQAGFGGTHPEDRVSKIFTLHRRGVFRSFLGDSRVVRILIDAIGPNVDCFLSQFIFKNPSAWGQPWHQDAHYFPFEPARPVVGLWLAVTDATLENGCLHILPGSQTEPVHTHVPDARPRSQYGYVEIIDHDMRAAQPVLLSSGDLLVFDSHLMHRSTDNRTNTLRAAMVWHFAQPETLDRGMLIGGKRIKSPIHDWMPTVRDGRSVLGDV